MMTLAVPDFSCHAKPTIEVGLIFGAVSSASFLFLFPGYVSYHYGVNAGWWGPIFGGMFGGGAAVVAALAFVTLPLGRAMRQPLGALQFMLICTLFYLVAWTFAGGLRMHTSGWVSAILVESAATLLIWGAMFFIGARLTTCPVKLRRLMLLSVLMIFICFAHAFYTFGFPAGPLLAFAGTDEATQANYQGVGRSLLVVGLMMAFSIKPEGAAPLLVLAILFLLMLSIGSRAHLAVLAVTILVHLTSLLAFKGSRLVGFLTLLITIMSMASITDLILDTRAGEIFDLASSASWNERLVASSRAVEVIAEFPVTGLFGYHHWDRAGYAHNALAAWTQYGLVGFLLLVSISVYALYVSFKGLVASEGRASCWAVALHCNLVAILLAIVFEPVMLSVFPALAWGLTLRAQRADAELRSR